MLTTGTDASRMGSPALTVADLLELVPLPVRDKLDVTLSPAPDRAVAAPDLMVLGAPSRRLVVAVQLVAKRALDLTVSLVLLLLLAPVLAVVAVAIKLGSTGPVLFRQIRIGRDGKPFSIYKFRTMTVGAESYLVSLRPLNDVDGPLFKLHEDPRVTSVGRILRRLSIDEIPQLLNVIKGEMSLVGPRPFVPAESEAFGDWSAARFTVRPGMTGHWQTSGRNDLPFSELKRLDFEYVSQWSLWWDARILARTPLSVLRRNGAY